MKKSSLPTTIGFYSPYIPKHFGGGERHLFTIAAVLSRFYQVTVGIPQTKELTDDEIDQIRYQYSEKFGLDLSWIHFAVTPLGTSTSFFRKLAWTKQFDTLFAVSDGSVFFSKAKKNILHVQIPFPHGLTGIVNRLKLSKWELNTNSVFTKQVIEKRWDKKVESVLYPCVDIHTIVPGKKEKIILHIGRFYRHLHAKRQDILIEVFKLMVKKQPQAMKSWKLICIGAIEDQAYADELHELAKGYPIEFRHHVEYEDVVRYLAKARIYWHATGYNIDEFLFPENVEHFGITTVEAMAAGCIPIVINKGGQKEIVEHGVSGFLWNSADALQEKTLAIINKEIDVQMIADAARKRAEFFDQSHFIPDVFKLFNLPEPTMTPLQPNGVSVVIPTYNGVKLLKKHLPSVITCLRDGDQIIIVDDASSDETVQWLKSRYKLKEVIDRASFDEDLFKGQIVQSSKQIDLIVVVNRKNLRFGMSVNKGVSFSERDLIFLLNNDVSPKKDVLEHLLPYFSAHPNRVNHKKSLYPSPLQVFGVSPAEIDEDSNLAGRNTLWFQRGLFVHSKASKMASGETAWLIGGAALISRAKWDELGGFDAEYYPAYWEDIDLSFRARKKGWHVLFEHNAQVFHRHETTNQDAFGRNKMDVMSIKNAFVFGRKHTNIFQKIQFLLWLPYHLLITNRKSKGAFVQGLLAYVIQRWG